MTIDPTALHKFTAVRPNAIRGAASVERWWTRYQEARCQSTRRLYCVEN